jgi:hypothetical protein
MDLKKNTKKKSLSLNKQIASDKRSERNNNHLTLEDNSTRHYMKIFKKGGGEKGIMRDEPLITSLAIEKHDRV